MEELVERIRCQTIRPHEIVAHCEELLQRTRSVEERADLSELKQNANETWRILVDVRKIVQEIERAKETCSVTDAWKERMMNRVEDLLKLLHELKHTTVCPRLVAQGVSQMEHMQSSLQQPSMARYRERAWDRICKRREESVKQQKEAPFRFVEEMPHVASSSESKPTHGSEIQFPFAVEPETEAVRAAKERYQQVDLAFLHACSKRGEKYEELAASMIHHLDPADMERMRLVRNEDTMAFVQTVQNTFVKMKKQSHHYANVKHNYCLWGPSGTGKTTMVYLIANTLGLPCLQMSSSNTTNSLVGETEKKMEKAFAMLNQVGFCVLLMDEADSFVSEPSGQHKDYMERVQSTLRMYMERSQKIFLFMTTNMGSREKPYSMNTAIRDRVIPQEVPPPSIQEILSFLEQKMPTLVKGWEDMREDAQAWLSRILRSCSWRVVDTMLNAIKTYTHPQMVYVLDPSTGEYVATHPDLCEESTDVIQSLMEVPENCLSLQKQIPFPVLQQVCERAIQETDRFH